MLLYMSHRSDLTCRLHKRVETSLNVKDVNAHRWLQASCGVPKRTVLLEDIKDFLDEEDMQDHLEIYFQKPSNFGGEVDAIKYTSKGGVMAYFSEDMRKPEA